MPSSHGIICTLFICSVVICSEVQAQNKTFTSFTRFKRQFSSCGFKCKDGSCIAQEKECNGKIDCADGSDETEHCKKIRCPSYLYRCTYGACISKSAVCNGVRDCKDNSDETGPHCAKSGLKDQNCGPYKFQCNSGECIDPEFQCNGKADCIDKSDETEKCKNLVCPKYVRRCDYGACINRKKICDGVQDCLDGSDEAESKCGKNNVSPTPTTTEAPPTVKPPPKPTPQPVTSAPDSNSCILPRYPDNGKWTIVPGLSGVPGQQVQVNTVIEGTCDHGFALEQEEHSYSKCTSSGWSKTFRCLQLCPPVVSTDITKVSCTLYNNARSCSSPVEGTILELTCADHFENLSSSKYRKCKDRSWDSSAIKCTPVCGTKNVDAKPLLVGGNKVNKGDYPWMTALFRKDGSVFNAICGGSLIHPQVVLTAAHCVAEETNTGIVTYDPQRYEVGVGKYYRNYHDPNDKNAQYSPVKEIVAADEYRGLNGNYAGDIAILILVQKFTLTHFVQPVCMDNTNLINLHSGDLGVVSGWGLTKAGGDSSNELRELQIPFEEDATCRTTLDEEFVRKYFSNDKICAGYYNQSMGVCQGDSGGGLVFELNHRFYLKGIVSVSINDRENYCNVQQYALYTRVDKFNDFISKTRTIKDVA